MANIDLISIDKNKYKKYTQEDFFNHIYDLKIENNVGPTGEDKTEENKIRELNFIDILHLIIIYLKKHKENKDIYLFFKYIYSKFGYLHEGTETKGTETKGTETKGTESECIQSRDSRSFLGILFILKYTDLTVDHHLIKKCIIYLLKYFDVNKMLDTEDTTVKMLLNYI